MTTFIARGKLGGIPAGIWDRSGSTVFAYLEVGDQRIDGVSVGVYLDGALQDCVGEQVELSFCRIGKGRIYLCAIKAESGKVISLPDPSGTLVTETIVSTVVFGVLALITTFLISPILFGIPLYVFRSLLNYISDTAFEHMMFVAIVGLWGAQLTWMLFYSKRFSPRLRIRTINKARTALG